MPISVEPVRLRIDWARLMEDEPAPDSEGVAAATWRLFLVARRRELRDSRFRAGGRLRVGLGDSLSSWSSGGVGSRTLRSKGRRGMGRISGGPLSFWESDIWEGGSV